jgi:hypothetical protein
MRAVFNEPDVIVREGFDGTDSDGGAIGTIGAIGHGRSFLGWNKNVGQYTIAHCRAATLV